MVTYPKCIRPRRKGQRREFVTIDYTKISVVGEFEAQFGYDPRPRTAELLLAEVDGRMYPCYRIKATKPGVITAICQDTNYMSCSVEEFQKEAP